MIDNNDNRKTRAPVGKGERCIHNFIYESQKWIGIELRLRLRVDENRKPGIGGKCVCRKLYGRMQRFPQIYSYDQRSL